MSMSSCFSKSRVPDGFKTRLLSRYIFFGRKVEGSCCNVAVPLPSFSHYRRGYESCSRPYVPVDSQLIAITRDSNDIVKSPTVRRKKYGATN